MYDRKKRQNKQERHEMQSFVFFSLPDILNQKQNLSCSIWGRM